MNLLKSYLINLCKSNKISGYNNLKKDKLIKLIKKGGFGFNFSRTNIGSVDIDTLKKYIKKLKPTKSCNTTTCKKREGSKAQTILICDTKIIKGALNNKYEPRIEYAKKSIKLDSITMNLLIQSITKKFVEEGIIDDHRVEHYSNLCQTNGKIKLESAKANYKGFPTLEDFILKYHGVDKLEIIESCLLQSFEILDKLHKDIQFHHCDPKCAQLFLFKPETNTNIPVCMLADLDKVTFTLKINNHLYHIHLTKDTKKNSIKGIGLSFLQKIGLLDPIVEMRFEDKPRKNNLLEKIIFVASACLLLKNYDEAIRLRDIILKKLIVNNNNFNFNTIIELNKDSYNSYNNTKRKSLSTPISIVKIKNADYDGLLKSVMEIKFDLRNIKNKDKNIKKQNLSKNIKLFYKK
jgi:hypothetical protein